MYMQGQDIFRPQETPLVSPPIWLLYNLACWAVIKHGIVNIQAFFHANFHRMSFFNNELLGEK